jgi:phosphosulfolactate synthase (CoM biosynthesis protein A)
MNKGLMAGQSYVVDTDLLIHKCEACLEAGAWKVMIEEEGLVENVKEYRTDVLFKLASRVDMEHLVFEASAGMLTTGSSATSV